MVPTAPSQRHCQVVGGLPFRDFRLIVAKIFPDSLATERSLIKSLVAKAATWHSEGRGITKVI